MTVLRSLGQALTPRARQSQQTKSSHRTTDWTSAPTRAELAAVLVLLLVAILVRLPTLDQPLLEAHSFRQTQTAYTSQIYHEQGIDLLHPKLPVLGAPFEVPFEFPLFQAVASGPMSWGLPPDTALRVTGMFFFLLSAILLYGVVRRAAGPLAAIGALVAFLFSPFGLLWGRTSMIEYLATAGSLAFVAMSMLWIERPRAWVGAVGAVSVAIALLVKITTGAFWILPALLFRAPEEPPGWRQRLSRRLPLLMFAGVALALALAWTRHADSIKAANPATAWLTSDALSEWNFGTLEQRSVAANWAVIGDRTAGLLGWPAWLILLSAVPISLNRQRAFWVGWLATGVLPIVTFFNLYVVHDYYLAAVSPVFAGLTGMMTGWLWENRQSVLGGALAVMIGAAAAVMILVAAVGIPLVDSRDYWAAAYRNPEPEAVFPAVAELRESTHSGDLVVVEGYDWDPSLLYYARRRGQMVDVGKFVTSDFVVDLPGKGYRYLVTSELTPHSESMLRAMPWTGVSGSQMYVMGDTYEEMDSVHAAATDLFDLAQARGPVVLDGPISLECGSSPIDLPSVHPGLILRVSGPDPASGLISFHPDLAPIPLRRWLLLGPSITERISRITCAGTEAVVFQGAWELRPPA